MKLKNFFTAILTAATTLTLLASCADDPEDPQTLEASSGEHTTIVETPTDAITLPAPGQGTVTAETETPLAESQITTYKGADGSTIKVANHFTDDGAAWIVVEKDGGDPLKLTQKDVWANGGIYSDGNFTWEAQGSSAKLTVGNTTVKYQAQMGM